MKTQTSEKEQLIRAEIMKVKDGKRAIVTLVQDDGTIDTIRFMNSELEKNDLCATLALIASFVTDKTVSDYKRELEKGRMNVASHSYTHTYIGENNKAQSGILSDGTPFSIPDGNMTREIIESRAHLRRMFPGERVLCYVNAGAAAPNDLELVSSMAREMISEEYISARTTGIPDFKLPPDNWHRIPSLMVMANHDVSHWTDALERVIESEGWLTYCIHRILPDGMANGIHICESQAKELFSAIGRRVNSTEVWCAYFDEASIYIREAVSSKLSLESSGEGAVKLTLTNDLDNSVYNMPITVRLQICKSISSFKILRNGKEEALPLYEAQKYNYAYLNIIPNRDTVYISDIKL